MDPASHATFAVTLVEALGARAERDGTIVRGAVMAAVLGALSPDIDAAVMLFGWDRYLRVHEVWTHTVVGASVCGLLTGALVWLFVRRRYWTLALCASIAANSHVLLDLLSSARLKPGWPLIDTVVSLPVVAMADPWMLTLCVIGAFSVRFARDSGRGAAIALGLIAAFVAAKGTLGYVAVGRYREMTRHIGAPVIARVIEAEWATMTRWRVSDATATQLRVWTTSAAQPPRLVLSHPRTRESELVTRSRSFSTVANFLAVHELTFPTVVHDSPPDTSRTTPSIHDSLPDTNRAATIFWSDIRFCWKPDRPGTPLACGLWFGGEIGADGRLGREIVKIGSFTQIRGTAPTAGSR